MTEQKRAVIWKAVSSKEQAEDDLQSLPYQEARAREWCEKQGYTVTTIMDLPGHSRSESDVITALEELAAEGCYAYHDLRRMWQQKAFDVLIVHTIDRLARSRSLFIWVVENVIKSGGEIYFMSPGMLFNKGNVDYAPAMAMMGLRSALDAFFEKSKATKMAKLAKGIPTGGKKPYGFTVLRDEKHRPCGIEASQDPHVRAVLEDAAALLLEGVSLRKIEEELFSRFGHNRNGKPYPVNFIRGVLNNPWTWGHASHNHDNSDIPGGQAMNPWLFDSSLPVPEHITIHWNNHPALFDDTLAERLMEEMRIRRQIVKGRGKAKSTAFAGLILCGWCNHAMIRNGVAAGANPRIRCQTNHRRNRAADCPNPNSKVEGVMEWRVRDYMQALLEDMLANDSPTLDNADGEPDRETQLRKNNEEMNTLRQETMNLITRAASSLASVSDLFQQQIDERAVRIEALEAATGRLRAQVATQHPRAQAAAFEELKAHRDDLWEMPATEINRILHGVLGNVRLVIKDNRVFGRMRV